MAAAIRSTNGSGTKFGGTYAGAFPAGTTTGDVVYACIMVGGGTLTPPSGWTQVATADNGKGLVYRRVIQAGDTAPTWAVSASNQWNLAYITISGVDGTTPEDTAAQTQASNIGTTVTPKNINITASTGAVVLYVMAGFGAAATTSGSGITQQYGDGHLWVDSVNPSSYGTYVAPQITFSATQGSADFGVITLAVRPAGVPLYQYGPTTASTAAAPAAGGRLVRSPDNTRWLPEAKPNPLLRPATAYLRGPNVFSGCKSYTNGVATQQLTTRRQHIALFDGVDPVFVFGNMQSQEQITNLGPLTVSAVVEVLPNGGSGSDQSASGLWRLTFNGQSTVTIQPGAYVKSDPLPLRLWKGRIYYTRTFATTTTGNQIPVQALFVDGSRFETSDSITTTDTTGNTTANALVNNSAVGGYGPQAVEATPLGRASLPMVVGTGDSILDGVSRGNLRSWFDQVLELALVPHLKVSVSGEQNIQFYGQPGTTSDSVGRKYRGRFLAGATDIVSDYSINDITSSATFAQMQSRILTAASIAAYYGARFHQTTFAPHTSSTDSWATTANQTPSNAGQETIRTQANAWLRDGAPINGSTGVAVATGDASGTTIRAGVYGHPVAGVFDMAGAVEVSNGTSLVWQVNAATTDGLHPGDSGHNMIANSFAAYCSTRFAPYPG